MRVRSSAVDVDEDLGRDRDQKAGAHRRGDRRRRARFAAARSTARRSRRRARRWRLRGRTPRASASRSCNRRSCRRTSGRPRSDRRDRSAPNVGTTRPTSGAATPKPSVALCSPKPTMSATRDRRRARRGRRADGQAFAEVVRADPDGDDCRQHDRIVGVRGRLARKMRRRAAESDQIRSAGRRRTRDTSASGNAAVPACHAFTPVEIGRMAFCAISTTR